MTTTVPEAAIAPGSSDLRELLSRIAAGTETRERENIAPFEQVEWVRAAGLAKLRLPRDEGGSGASLRELFATLIDLGRGGFEPRSHPARSLLVRRAAADDRRS